MMGGGLKIKMRLFVTDSTTIKHFRLIMVKKHTSVASVIRLSLILVILKNI